MRWFKHMSDMEHDPRISRLIDRYGLEGFGLYNLVLGRIVRKIETDSPVPDLEEGSQDLARVTHGDTARIEEIIQFCIRQGLFTLDDSTRRVVAMKIYRYLQQSETRSPAIRKLIVAYRERKTTEVVVRSPTYSHEGGQQWQMDLSNLSQTIYDTAEPDGIEPSNLSQTIYDTAEPDGIEPSNLSQTIYDGEIEGIEAKNAQKPPSNLSETVSDNYEDKTRQDKTRLDENRMTSDVTGFDYNVLQQSLAAFHPPVVLHEDDSRKVAVALAGAGLDATFAEYASGRIAGKKGVQNPPGLLLYVLQNPARYPDWIDDWQRWRTERSSSGSKYQACSACGAKVLLRQLTCHECGADLQVEAGGNV